MTKRERIAIIRRDMRIALRECKMALYRELIEELAIVLRA